jgi:hypothetical protein
MKAGAARSLLPPLAAYLLARLFLIVPGVLTGYDTLRSGTWRRWDSGHYLAIARNGYELVRCGPPNYPPDSWCGTAAWLPGYPWLVRWGPWLGIPREAFGVLLSGAFTVALLVVLWNTFLRAEICRDNVLALILAAFFPGSVYFHAIFPISMTALAVLLCAGFLRGERWPAAGLCGAAASFTYPNGLLLAPLSGVWAWYRSRGESARVRAGRLLSTTAVAASGLAAVLFLHGRALGAWDAFFKVQGKYGHDRLRNPGSALLRALSPLFDGDPDRLVPALQTLLVALIVLAIGVAMLVRRKDVESFDVWVFALGLSFWGFPFAIGRTESLYRSEALLVPVVLLTRFLPWTVQAALVGLFVALDLHLAALFFESVLV